MRRKRLFAIFLSVAVMASCFTTGCENKASVPPEQPSKEADINLPQKDLTEKEKDQEDHTKTDGKEDLQEREILLYYVDEQTGNMTEKKVVIRDEADIWKELQNAGILTEECELLDFSINDSDRTIDLDVNLATGEMIRSMGTSGELVIVSSILNTYLDAYQCEKIKVTEEGEALVTSHGANYGNYSERIEY